MCIDKCGSRWIVAVMIFVTQCINYMMRVNISVNIVAMAPVSNVTYSHSHVKLDWTPYQRAQILSSYFWGYVVSNFFSAFFIQRFGSRLVVVVMVALSAVLTLLAPVAAEYSYIMILIVRIAIGFCSGFLLPAMFTLIGNWAVPNERGKFLAAVIAATIGTFIAWSLCGIVIEAFGWEWGFYTFGIISLLWCIPWWFLIYDCPDSHPRISLKEMEYINGGTKVKKMETKKFNPTPYRRMMTSLSVWSLLIMNFGSGWGIYFVITAAPNYVSNALGYKISSSGWLSGISYLSRSCASIIFGSVGDILLKKNILSIRALRKIATVGSHIVPGCLVMCMSISGFPRIVYVILMTLAMTLNALITQSCLANAYDLTTNFVGSLTSFANVMTTASGIITPLVTAYFTKSNEVDPEVWKPVFYTGSLVYIISGLQFLVFGSTKKEPWDKLEPSKEVIDMI